MSVKNHILGIHHVTAIAGDPQRNLDFYAGILGLRLVKRTVNFDDPYTYHLYYGDEQGHPGTLLTFFPWSSDRRRGRKGANQLTGFSFSIPEGSIDFWTHRLTSFKVDFSGPVKRFHEEVITVMDHDGFQFDLVVTSRASHLAWDNGIVPPEFAVGGIHSVTLSKNAPDHSQAFLTMSMGFRSATESGNRSRFEIGAGGSGTFIDLLSQPDAAPGSMGVGIIHHVAWRTKDDATQLEVRNGLVSDGLTVTPVIDRNYFHSIYLNEPGGVIFEVATDLPGFMIDESKEMLGSGLMLPGQYEPYRSELVKILAPLNLPRVESPDIKSFQK